MSAPTAEELHGILDLVLRETGRYLGALDGKVLERRAAERVLTALDRRLPEEGYGALEAVEELIEAAPAAVRSAGPRFFHFVVGGVTPAALGADWWTSVLDQNAFAWASSPLAARLETVTIEWLKDLFGLPETWGGVLTSGATGANLAGLAAARQWWAERHGVDAAAAGISGLPPMPVLSGAYLHASVSKALAVLGVGKDSVSLHVADEAGGLDLEGLARALERLGGAPAVLIATAGEVNAGGFDPISAMADLAEEHGSWLHVDGAFGLFAACSPRTQRLVDGVQGAHSVISDGHKWLNVPYDSGFAFVRDPRYLFGAFSAGADYLPGVDDSRPAHGFLAPEMSRRARALPIWATLAAYGRSGYREMVERHLDLAAHMAVLVDEAPELERLAEVALNIVCFRARPPGLSEAELQQLNERLGEAILSDGRFFAGTTRYGGRVALRPAIVNWRTTREDVELFVRVVRELLGGLMQ